MSIRFVLGLLIGLLLGASIALALTRSGGAKGLAQHHGDE
jgi:hypothetical protein